MEFKALIEERYSVRKFKPEHLSKEVIDEILKAGHLGEDAQMVNYRRMLMLV